MVKDTWQFWIIPILDDVYIMSGPIFALYTSIWWMWAKNAKIGPLKPWWKYFWLTFQIDLKMGFLEIFQICTKIIFLRPGWSDFCKKVSENTKCVILCKNRTTKIMKKIILYTKTWSIFFQYFAYFRRSKIDIRWKKQFFRHIFYWLYILLGAKKSFYAIIGPLKPWKKQIYVNLSFVKNGIFSKVI